MLIIFFAVLIALVLLSILSQAIFLKLGLHWVKSDDRSFRNAFAAMTVATVVGYLLVGGLFYFDLMTESVAGLLVTLLILVVANIVVIQYYFGTSILRSVQALLPTILAPLISVPIVQFGIVPNVCESFIVPTNSMAPTVLGRHFESICPDCGQAEMISTNPYGDPSSHGICQNFHTRIVNAPKGEQHEGDRIFVAKFLEPNRWDVAAFALPSDPAITYIKRVVGLPGETIYIEDGFVFADGKKLTPPERLAGLTYSTNIGTEALHGSKDNPAVLGDDEYFVLGDNTERALDSRYWSRGAEGHNPYAVPESNISGVAITIYWPPKRWKSLK